MVAIQEIKTFRDDLMIKAKIIFLFLYFKFSQEYIDVIHVLGDIQIIRTPENVDCMQVAIKENQQLTLQKN